jgi:Bardet-Biedl syndrome 9 protein
MSKSGDVYVGYLGTDPTLFSAPRSEARQVNYEECDAELASLNTIIKAAQSIGTTFFDYNLSSI